MNEDLLRAMIRQSVSRHLGPREPAAPEPQPLPYAAHASHYRYALPESEGPCLIEPAVRCNRCGYCESHGY